MKSEPNWKRTLRYDKCRWKTVFYCDKCWRIIGELRKRPKSILHKERTSWCKCLVWIEGDYWKPMNCGCGGIPDDLDINVVIETLSLKWIRYRYSRGREGHVTPQGYRADLEPRSSRKARKGGHGRVIRGRKGGGV